MTKFKQTVSDLYSVSIQNSSEGIGISVWMKDPTELIQWKKYLGMDIQASSVQDGLDLFLQESRTIPDPHQNLCEVPLWLRNT